MSKYLDDNALERLNALAIAPEPGGAARLSPRRTIAAALFEHMLAQEDGSRWKLGIDGCVVVTDRWLIDRPLPEVAATVESGSIVERAAALARLVSATEEPWAGRRTEWQRQLSHLMVRYPVLLDHRLAFCGFTDTFEWAPLPHLLAYAPFGRLPCLAHDISEPELRRFASLQCVRNGLTRRAAGQRSTGARLAGRTADNIVMGDAVEAAAGYPLRGQMMLALLELSDLAAQETGKPFYCGAGAAQQLEGVQNHLGRIFWDVAAAGGAASGLTRVDFTRAVSLLGKTMRWASVGDVLYGSIGAYTDIGLQGPQQNAPSSAEYKVAGVRHAIEMLVAIGAEPDARTAAQACARQLVGGGRLSPGVAANWPPNHILSVLDELGRHHVRIELTGADTGGALSDRETFVAWRDAIDMHARLADMQTVIAAGTSRAADSGKAPALRRRARSL